MASYGKISFRNYKARYFLKSSIPCKETGCDFELIPWMRVVMFVVYFSLYFIIPWLEVTISAPYEWNSSIETVIVIINIVLLFYILPKLLGYFAYCASFSLSNLNQM